MIILKTLTWNNCFSYSQNNKLELDAFGLAQILGENGAGKSSVPLIIEEVLFNKNSKNTKKVDIPNRSLDGSYSIELDFKVDEDDYIVKVNRKKTLKVSLFKNQKDISSHTATNTFKTIEQILGVDYKTFSQLVYQNTNSSLQFLTATDTTRKRFLIDLLNLDKYVQYFEKFKVLVKDYNNKVVGLESKVETVRKWLSENNLEGMVVLKPLNLEINTEEDEKALASLTEEFKNISKINKKISSNNHYKEQLKLIDLNKYSDITGKKQSIDSLNTKLGELLADKASSTKELNKISKLSDQCPTCNQKVDKEFIFGMNLKHSKNIEVLDEEILELRKEIDSIKATNKKLEEKQRAEDNFQSTYSSIDFELQETPLNANSLKEEIEEIKRTLTTKRADLQKVIQENARIERNNTKISLIKEQTEEFEVQLSTLIEELIKAEQIHKNLELLKKAFSTNGLLAYKIEYLVKELETLVNEYLAELSDGRFTLTFAITNDKLNVIIGDNGKEVDISALSSGELARVNTSTLLAIRKLMNSISKSRINVLFLDEVIAVLDESGREKLVDVLVKEEKLNTFIVSHQWSHPLLSKINIVKENDISRVEYGCR